MVAIIIQPLARMGTIEYVGLRIGMALTLMTIGVVSGAPISGAILDTTGSFKNVGYYGGASWLLTNIHHAGGRLTETSTVQDRRCCCRLSLWSLRGITWLRSQMCKLEGPASQQY